MIHSLMPVRVALALASTLLLPSGLGAQNGIQPNDLHRLRSVGEVHLSPDGRHAAYTLQSSDRPGHPYSQVRILRLADGTSWRLGTESAEASGVRWSPDGQRVAFFGREDERSGLWVADADGSSVEFVAPVEGTNHPLPSAGERVSWSPDGRQLAFISSTPGTETEDANGDPMVISRYLYKPHAGEGMTRFNDNRRVHIFLVELASRQVRQLTDGPFYEHSIDWSPRGDEILFISNREPDPDRVFNYDIFAVRVADGTVRRLTDTRSAEYAPRWSPDGRTIAFLGTTRPFTSSETTMEDTHVWLIDSNGGRRREPGAAIDDRQRDLGWASDGRSVFFTVQRRGSVHLYRLPVDGGEPEVVVGERGAVRSWSAAGARVAHVLTTPDGPAELYLKEPGQAGPGRRLTDLNAEVLAGRRIAEVEAFTFRSFDGREVEAFLTRPLVMRPGDKHPMIVSIHGGPHGQQGPAFNPTAQAYAERGWATLMVNYRGSTGYGQEHADAIFGDQNGGEARDVLEGVDAALARHSWIDPERLGVEGGSYGGQLANWIITRTDRFRAAIPRASISNLVSFNYMAYYHDYLAVEFGRYPHEDGLIDVLWERSPLRYANRVKTPTLLVHGENDNDVPIAEAEQFYIALKDVGVETVMIRYPREGHGIRETAHQVDFLQRSIAWYERFFRGAAPASPN